MKAIALALPVALLLFLSPAPRAMLRVVSGVGLPADAVPASLPAPRTGAGVQAKTRAGAANEQWRVFEGGWSASGHREFVPTEGPRAASTVYLSGAVVLNVSEGVSRGFLGEAIGFDDGTQVTVGRCVWTDERGDRIFSTLRGESLGTGRRWIATITGGTGRYTGIAGEYSFEWQYVVEAERGSMQGRAVSLKGRYRAAGGGR